VDNRTKTTKKHLSDEKKRRERISKKKPILRTNS